MKIHELKTIQPFFNQIKNGTKKFELRKNDRGFLTGDILILKEYDSEQEAYVHIVRESMVVFNEVVVRITGILHTYDGLHPDYCILSISNPI